MIPNAFRTLVRSQTDLVVVSYLGSEQVRFRNIEIGSIGYPDPTVVVLRLPQVEQARLIAKDGAAFSRTAGGLGARGGTRIKLELADDEDVAAALQAACLAALKLNHIAPSKPRAIY
jgi:hypothetical protein